MLRLSSKERYAIHALFDMAFYASASPTQVKDIAVRQRIPERFLEQIFQDLKRAGLVASKRGPNGGYRLMRAPSEIAVGDVVRATSGVAQQARPSRTPRAPRSPELRDVAGAVLDELSRSVQQCLDAVTLEDVCRRGESLGLRRPSRLPRAYAI
jgi:Rrf2 family protein